MRRFAGIEEAVRRALEYSRMAPRELSKRRTCSFVEQPLSAVKGVPPSGDLPDLSLRVSLGSGELRVCSDSAAGGQLVCVYFAAINLIAHKSSSRRLTARIAYLELFCRGVCSQFLARFSFELAIDVTMISNANFSNRLFACGVRTSTTERAAGHYSTSLRSRFSFL